LTTTTQSLAASVPKLAFSSGKQNALLWPDTLSEVEVRSPRNREQTDPQYLTLYPTTIHANPCRRGCRRTRMMLRRLIRRVIYHADMENAERLIGFSSPGCGAVHAFVQAVPAQRLGDRT